jgi:hypothetical protein
MTLRHREVDLALLPADLLAWLGVGSGRSSVLLSNPHT